jgi:chromate transport protein ChrA
LNSLTEVFLLFLRLGLTAFGGPAAHVASMHDEVVKRRNLADPGRGAAGNPQPVSLLVG